MTMHLVCCIGTEEISSWRIKTRVIVASGERWTWLSGSRSGGDGAMLCVKDHDKRVQSTVWSWWHWGQHVLKQREGAGQGRQQEKSPLRAIVTRKAIFNYFCVLPSTSQEQTIPIWPLVRLPCIWVRHITFGPKRDDCGVRCYRCEQHLSVWVFISMNCSLPVYLLGLVLQLDCELHEIREIVTVFPLWHQKHNL